MPRRPRRSGFTKVKGGRSKTERGGLGRGSRGRRRVATELVQVGELSELDDTIQSLADSDTSNHSDAFRAALLSPTPSETPSDFSENQSIDQGSEGSESLDSSDISQPSTLQLPVQELCFKVPDVPAEHQDKEPQTSTIPENALVEENPLAFVPQVLENLKLLLPPSWIAVSDSTGLHVMLLSRGHIKAIQRNIFVALDGSVKVTDHRKNISQETLKDILDAGGHQVSLKSGTAGAFADRIQALVMKVRSYEVCTGAQYSDYEKFWDSDEQGYADKNPYDESRYEQTFRSYSCALILPGLRSWRCKECTKAVNRFKKRVPEAEDVNPNKPNVCLSKEEALKKMAAQHKELRNTKSTLDKLRKGFNLSLESQGVAIDKSLEEKLEDIFKDVSLTPVQEMFIQQQFKSASLKDKRQMRWHPTLIRFALLIKSNSTATYRAMRDAGFVQLPGERTLFDYSNIMPRKEGCFKERFDKIYKEVEEQSKGEEFKTYHTLILDEVHISQKLVCLKSTGTLVGYVSLTEAETGYKSTLGT